MSISADQRPVSSDETSDAPNTEGEQHTKRLLLADDDRLILATLGEGLRQAGYEVEVTDRGEAALDKALSERPDLVILDVRMPDRSGTEVARALHEKTDIPILFLSAYDDQELVDQAGEEGALGYLVKPLNVNQVVPAIETALRRADQLQRLSDKEQQLNAALETNRDISVAIGVLMERHGLPRDDAFETLRRHARTRRRRVVEIARELIQAAEVLDQFRPSSS